MSLSLSVVPSLLSFSFEDLCQHHPGTNGSLGAWETGRESGEFEKRVCVYEGETEERKGKRKSVNEGVS